MLKDILVWCVFLPGDAKYASKASVDALFLFRTGCPRFATIEEGALAQAWYTQNLGFSVSMLFSHNFLDSLDLTDAAFPICYVEG